MRRLPLLALAVALALVLSGCGGGSSASQAQAAAPCPTASTTSFAKTKFVAHAGLAFGAFHRYLYKPYQAGSFKSGADGRVKAFVKAGAAALFIKREVRLASVDAHADPTLCTKIVQPLDHLADTISDAVSKLKGGDASGLTGANTAISGVESSSQSEGTSIAEDENAKV